MPSSCSSTSDISSVDSEWNDKSSIAAQLGISNPDDMANERFKVDRQKLENLIKGDYLSIANIHSHTHTHTNAMQLQLTRPLKVKTVLISSSIT